MAAACFVCGICHSKIEDIVLFARCQCNITTHASCSTCCPECTNADVVTCNWADVAALEQLTSTELSSIKEYFRLIKGAGNHHHTLIRSRLISQVMGLPEWGAVTLDTGDYVRLSYLMAPVRRYTPFPGQVALTDEAYEIVKAAGGEYYDGRVYPPLVSFDLSPYAIDLRFAMPEEIDRLFSVKRGIAAAGIHLSLSLIGDPQVAFLTKPTATNEEEKMENDDDEDKPFHPLMYKDFNKRAPGSRGARRGRPPKNKNK